MQRNRSQRRKLASKFEKLRCPRHHVTASKLTLEWREDGGIDVTAETCCADFTHALRAAGELGMEPPQ